jgi:hypothetical protein
VVEILSKRSDIAKYAVVESALVVPCKKSIHSKLAAIKLVYELSRQKWVARMRARALCVIPEAFSQYYQESLHISYASWSNVKKSKTEYAAPAALSMSNAKVLVIIGSEEIKAMDQSVRLFMNAVPDPHICIVPEMRHGELSLAHCTEYLALIKHFIMCPCEHKTREPL